MKVDLYLSLGSNQGDRRKNIEDAISLLNIELGTPYKAVSSFLETEPWGFESENGFYNIALTMESDLSPLDLLRETQRIEKELGRTAKTTTEYADRVIDIDIIDYDNQIIKISQQSTVNNLLTLPHPLMHLRNFVLYPLADIAPEWVHPILKLTTLELKAKSEDKSIPYKK